MLNENSGTSGIGGELVSLEQVLDYFANHYEIERADAENIIAVYAKSLHETLHKLQRNLYHNEQGEGACQAHSLKGAFLNLGLEKQAALASTLEKELRKEILERHKMLVERLICEMQPITERAALS